EVDVAAQVESRGRELLTGLEARGRGGQLAREPPLLPKPADDEGERVTELVERPAGGPWQPPPFERPDEERARVGEFDRPEQADGRCHETAVIPVRAVGKFERRRRLDRLRAAFDGVARRDDSRQRALEPEVSGSVAGVE